jgi:hypothetical protein
MSDVGARYGSNGYYCRCCATICTTSCWHVIVSAVSLVVLSVDGTEVHSVFGERAGELLTPSEGVHITGAGGGAVISTWAPFRDHARCYHGPAYGNLSEFVCWL